MSILEILIFIAGSLFVGGWLLVIFDALSGFRVIERLPSRFISALGSVHNFAWISIAVILLAGIIWQLANS